MDIDKLLPLPVDENDVHDLAHDYIEQEVGRFDWNRNWEKVRPRAAVSVRRWLRNIGENETVADEIIRYLDRLAKRYGHSRWR